jgi:hypothetical protein
MKDLGFRTKNVVFSPMKQPVNIDGVTDNEQGRILIVTTRS